MNHYLQPLKPKIEKLLEKLEELKLQDEVACGLVLNQNKLQELNTDETDDLISDEDCEINGKYFQSRSRLIFKDKINKIQVSKSSQLRKFFNDFYENLKDLKIEEIHPLTGYNFNLETEYQDKFWQATQKELKHFLLFLNINDIRIEPIFILELKALLSVLSEMLD